jgi:nucleoside phosphorylase
MIAGGSKIQRERVCQVERTLICFAVKQEAGPFAKRALGRPELSVLVTGMGPRNARHQFENALKSARPNRVLTCGFAGALDSRLALGTVVFDAEDDASLAAPLATAGAQPVRFCCAPRVATTKGEKQRLRLETGADAVEMESGVIRSLCRERRIPAATIRVISDTAAEDLPLDFNALLSADDRLSAARLFRALLLSPEKLPSLLRLQRQTRLAADNLARVLSVILGG